MRLRWGVVREWDGDGVRRVGTPGAQGGATRKSRGMQRNPLIHERVGFGPTTSPMNTHRNMQKTVGSLLPRFRPLLGLAVLLAVRSGAVADTAYGSLNNFDVVNDTGGRCYGFSIELDDINSTDVQYTYDYNHYGTPVISEDRTDPAHPRVFVRYESKKNPDGSFASYTNPQDPAHPLAPTDGHAFTNPSINLGGEHFGVSYGRNPSRVKYNWLVEDPANPGTLILGPLVTIATPAFTYLPAVDPAAGGLAQVRAAIEPEPPENEDREQYGPAVWVKIFKTVQKSGRKVKLGDLMSDDPHRDDDETWEGDEVAETEIEWELFQRRPANKQREDGEDEIEAGDDLPEGDEVVTRRYEFYAYTGPVNPEDGEAECSDLDKCPDALGAYIGAQMAGFDQALPLGMPDALQDGEVGTPYVDRSVVVGGNTPYVVAVSEGALPDGLEIDPVTGVLSGTPSRPGVFRFTVSATDADDVAFAKGFTLTVTGVVVEPPALPTIECPAPVVVATDANGCGAIVRFQPVVGGNPTAIAVCDPPSGSLFPIGTTVVTCHAETPEGVKSDACTFTVTVEDREFPTLTLPGLIVVDATSPEGAVAVFEPTATDNCTVAGVGCVPASGSVLPVGETVVTCTVEDAAGNKTVGAFVVRVKGAEQQLRELMLRVVGLPVSGKVRNELLHELREALDKLRRGKVRDASSKLADVAEDLQPRKLKGLPAAEAAALREQVARIRAVLGWSSGDED